MNDPKIRIIDTEPYKELSIRDLIAPVFRRRRALVITFACVFVGLILLALLMGPFYTSHMEILVNRERQDPLVTPEATTQLITNNTSAPVTDDEINSEVELLLSRDVLEQVVIENKLDENHGFSLSSLIHPNDTKDERVARAVKRLAKQLKIKAVAKTDLIDVQYSSANPQLAHSVLQSLGDAYIHKHVSVHRPSGSYQFFTNETQRYHDELEKAEGKLRDFAKSSNIAAPDVERTDLAMTLANSVGGLHAAQQAVAADEERIRSDRQQLSTTSERLPTVRSTAAADKLLGDLNSALLVAQEKRSMLAMKYDANYPLVKEADQEVAQAKEAIAEAEKTRYVTETTDHDPTYELIREDLAKAQADEAAQRATVAATSRSIANIQAQMVTLDRDALTQKDLTRDAQADETNYLLYLGKREQERTADALDMKRIANVAIAVPPAIPVLPVFSWPMILLLSLGIAVIISLGTAYGLDYLDSSFHTPAQVVDMLGIPVVVAVPRKSA